jgi:hypothetical protein
VTAAERKLVPQTEVCDELTVPSHVGATKVLQEPTTSAHHLEEPTSAMVVLLVTVEMGAEVVDALSEDRDLNRSASTIRIVELVLLDNSFFDDRHRRRASSRVSAAREAATSVN